MAESTLSSAEGLFSGGVLAMHESVATAIERTLKRPLPEVEVCFHDLHISARLPVTRSGAMGPQVPTIWTQIQQGVMKCFAHQETTEKDILRGVTGVFKPSRITLILGQPGSGKSSLLKILSGRFPMHKSIGMSGDITYNGVKRSEVLPRLPRFIAYTNQKDDHYPQLTVEETFAFAHLCCGGTKFEPWVVRALAQCKGDQYDHAVKVMTAQHKFAAQLRIKSLGLDRCKDTRLGNAMIRGVSGGERKRVTTGEMTFGRKRVMLLDEISTGLDAATTYDIVDSMKSLTRNFKSTIVVSLLQPPPEVFNLFDDVLIMNDGRIMYHGPRDQVQDYFEAMGFHCPPRKDVADFLVDLGTDKQHNYVRDGTTANVPYKAAEFADRFLQSDIFQSTLTYMKTRLHEKSELFDPLQDPHVFRQSFLGDLTAVLRRQWTIRLRDRTFLVGRSVMVMVMGLLYGSVFYQLNDANSQLLLGLLFSCTLFLSLGQVAQLPTFMEARSVFYKQRGANFFRSVAYVVATLVTQIPLAIFETVLFGSVVYWMGGYVALADRFSLFLVTLFLCQMWFTAYIFFLSTAAPNVTVAQPIMMVSILFFIMFGGFLLRKTDIPDYLLWVYWIDPVAWCIRSLSINQYLAPRFDVCRYGAIDYCSGYGTTFGKYSLQLSGLPTDEGWIYLGWLYFLLGFVVLTGAATFVLEYKRYESPESTTVVQADVDARNGPAEVKVNPAPRGGDDPPLDSQAYVSVPVATASPSVVPVTLAFHDLWYSVPMPGGTKGEDIDLLQGVSGFAKPGTMTALMGSSGAGKTTLLDVMAGRKTGGKIRGKLLLNGYPATDLAIRRCTGYCEQMDIHSESATIREALVFSAMLRQRASVSLSEKMTSVNECLALLELGPIADKIIRGSSTEQMKRLTIGVELVAQSSILFMDEPTSGLDARSAQLIMKGVRKIAQSGRTIVCTIHQPSAEVFGFFDALLLLRRGGRVVFFGPLGQDASNLIEYFEGVPGVPPIEAGYNPATWMLECIGAGVGATVASGLDFATQYDQSALKVAVDKALDDDGVLRPSNDLPELVFTSQFASTGWAQFTLLCRRFMHMYWRTPTYNLTRFTVSVMLGAIFGIIYQATDYTTFTGANAGVGLVFVSTVFLGMIGFNSVMPVAAEERTAFYRERASETYHALWYFLAGTLVEIPYVVLSALAFTVIFYPSVGFTGFGVFIQYWLVVSLNALLFVYFGQLLVYALPTVAVAATAGALLSSIFMLFSGFNPPANNIPLGFKWIYYIAPNSYTIAVLVALVFADCTDEKGTKLGCHSLKNAPPTVGNVSVKEYVESSFNMKHANINRNIAILCALIVAFRLLALLALRYISHLKR